MVVQKRTPNLLVLLEVHAGVALFEVPVASRPLTPILPWNSPTEQAEKKQKRDKKQDKEIVGKGEIQDQPPSKPTKGAKSARLQQKKSVSKSTALEVAAKHRLRVPNWNPELVLDGAPLPSDASIRDFTKGRVDYVVDVVE